MEQNDERTRLLDTARALLAKGEPKFSIASLCAEAGLERAVFRRHFTGKSALLAAAVSQTDPEPKAEASPPEPGVSTPDAWLERRLRVFERALNQLETRAEAAAREQEARMVHLEELVSRLGLRQNEQRPSPAVAPAAEPIPSAAPVVDAPEPQRPAPELLAIAPLPIVTVPRHEMADVLAAARGKAVPVPSEEPRDAARRLRWLAIGGLSLVALFLCVGLTMGDTASATQQEGTGVSHRHVANDAMRQLVARADAGDAQSQARLAMAYLRGNGVQSDVRAAARWSMPAAQAGQPIAEYLLGTLYGRGEGVTADAVRAFLLFKASARKGNLKAMHNLAIAYAQGQGTAKDEAKAAEWFTRAAERGYVDSAFDLAVLYERGEGVKQDLKQAMKWYAVAAFSGDAASQARVDFLRTQMAAGDIRLAMGAASSFSPLRALPQANSL